MGKRIPIAAMHRFNPWGIAGFAINITSGSMFLLTEPDQYIYNPSFHLKVIFIMIAGLNASMFYLTSYRRVFTASASLEAPTRAKVIAAISLSAWLVVIVCGRLLTFFRPAVCEGEQTSIFLTCFPPRSPRALSAAEPSRLPSSAQRSDGLDLVDSGASVAATRSTRR